ncbi:hypothetical protein ACWEKT_20085 [Nocardia takedensis]|uniref:hypothetical protein n=1 Tax=Nocardia takedensis TaxID=259390 RepID=UPI0002DE67F0|nr:hypothetical protein [Nocardia takedensis]
MREPETRDTMPLAPVRERALLPAGMELSLFAAVVGACAIFGGGALSALLSGHGIAAPGWAGAYATVFALFGDMSDPAAAWPDDPRPGPAWLTWTCIIVVAITVASTIMIARAEYDARRRRRRSNPGMAKVSDLRRAGLDADGAIDKAAAEYPVLAAGSRLPMTARLRLPRGWRR